MKKAFLGIMMAAILMALCLVNTTKAQPTRISERQARNFADLHNWHHNPNPDDRDADGWFNKEDNCPDWFNPDQRDTNHDGSGDACGIEP